MVPRHRGLPEWLQLLGVRRVTVARRAAIGALASAVVVQALPCPHPLAPEPVSVVLRAMILLSPPHVLAAPTVGREGGTWIGRRAHGI